MVKLRVLSKIYVIKTIVSSWVDYIAQRPVKGIDCLGIKGNRVVFDSVTQLCFYVETHPASSERTAVGH